MNLLRGHGMRGQSESDRTEPDQEKTHFAPASFRQKADIPAMSLQRSLHARDISHRLSAANADFHGGFRNVIRTGREADLAALACTQMDPLEAARIPDRSEERRVGKEC